MHNKKVVNGHSEPEERNMATSEWPQWRTVMEHKLSTRIVCLSFTYILRNSEYSERASFSK